MTALDKSTRRKIFYTMVLLFMVFVPLILLYSRGYIFDFKESGLELTGGIFVKTVQPDVKVFVDSNLENETSFISRGTLITGLLPRRYAVRAEKAGFQPWEKTVRVNDEEVVEFRNVLLPPATITPAAVFSTGKGAAPSRLAFLTGRSEIAMEIGDPAKPVSVFIVNPETNASAVTINRVSYWSWSEETQAFIIGRKAQGKMLWYRLYLQPSGTSAEEPISFRGLPKGFSANLVTPHPTIPRAFYFFAGGVLFLQDTSSVPTPIAEGVLAYAVAPTHLYFISKTGFLIESNLAGGNTHILGRKGLFLTESDPPQMLTSLNGDVALLDSAGGLFLYQPDRDQEIQLVAANVKGLEFSTNGDRMLYRDSNHIWLYWLGDNPDQPFDLARTKKQILSSDDPILRTAFIENGAYYFFSTRNGVFLSETDIRGSTNTYRLVNNPVGSFAIDGGNNILYWTDGGRLLKANFK